MPSFEYVSTYSSFYDYPYRLCSIESAGRVLPDSGRVKVFTSYVEDLRTKLPPSLEHKVDIVAIDPTKLFEGTPLSEWYENRSFESSPFPGYTLADALRLAVLFQYGGFYLDLDIIVLSETLFSRHSALARDANGVQVNNALLNFPSGHPFLSLLMNNLPEYSQHQGWGTTGPSLVSEIFQQCSTSHHRDCTDVSAMPAHHHAPYLINHIKEQLLGRANSTDLVELLAHHWALHYYNHQWHDVKCIPDSSLFDELMKLVCPESQKLAVCVETP
ncbi:TPA: Lactosylceramide 4-alpha-galactosyltransferase [Trebouxia sp. C0005]